MLDKKYPPSSSESRTKRITDEPTQLAGNWNPPCKAVKTFTAADFDDPAADITAVLAEMSIYDIADLDDLIPNGTADADEAEAREQRRLACVPFEDSNICIDVPVDEQIAATNATAGDHGGDSHHCVPAEEIDYLRELIDLLDDGIRVSWPVGWDELSARKLCRQASRTWK